VTATEAALLALLLLLLVLAVDSGRNLAGAVRRQRQLRRTGRAKQEADREIADVVRRAQADMLATILASRQSRPPG